MSAILEAARIQGSAKIERKAWAARGDIKFHLWELSTGGVILLKQMVGVGFDHPVKLEESLDVVVERFRSKMGNKVFAPYAARR